MSAPVKVDWTIEEPPKCEYCIHAVRRYGTRIECARKRKKHHDTPSIFLARRDGYASMFDLCGVSGKFFECREFAPEEYDFVNNPPELMAWAK